MTTTEKTMADYHDQIKQAMLNAWNFCGNQREAAEEVCYDYGVEFNEDIYDEISFSVSESINSIRKEILNEYS